MKLFGSAVVVIGFFLLTQFAHQRPTGAIPIRPPIKYQRWFREVERCSQIKGDFGTLKFYKVPGGFFLNEQHGYVIGQWVRGLAKDDIYIAEQHLNNKFVIKHEMLHALLGNGNHNPIFFKERCKLTWDTQHAS